MRDYSGKQVHIMLGIRAIHNKRSYCLPEYYIAEPKLKEHVGFLLTCLY